MWKHFSSTYMPSFSGTNMIHDAFTWNAFPISHDMPCFPLCICTFTSKYEHDFTSILSYILYDYDDILPVCTCFSFRNQHAKWMIYMPFLHDMTTSFLHAYAFSTGINMLHEWNDYYEWNDMTISFFYVHASFSGTNKPHEWHAFPIWHDYTSFIYPYAFF